MIENKNKVLHLLTTLIILLGAIASATGLFYKTGGKSYDFINQYGDTVKIYGDGIYAKDSYFKAPIFRGTDFSILFIAIPLLIFALLHDIKTNSIKSRMFLTSVISLFTYYSTSIAFGVTYNELHLVYIGFFSVSLFGLIVGIMSMDMKDISNSIGNNLPLKGINIFLIFTGISLIVAWLPDIITSLISNRSISLIEVYTTEITFVLDMGIISPIALICYYLLKKRDGLGFLILEILLTVCTLIGFMLPIQTIFQLQAGIEIPLPALITKVGIFVLLAVFATYFNMKLIKNTKS